MLDSYTTLNKTHNAWVLFHLIQLIIIIIIIRPVITTSFYFALTPTQLNQRKKHKTKYYDGEKAKRNFPAPLEICNVESWWL